MHPNRLLFLGIASLAFIILPTDSAAEISPAFRAGTARREITPQEPVPMWGYGARHDALSTGVLDPLYATALVLQAGSNKLAIVALDLGRSPNERSLLAIRDRIKHEAGIEHSFIAASHTHHGPVLELSNEEGKGKGKFDAALRYYTRLENEIVSAIVEANQRLVPSKIAVATVQLDGFNRNRHTKIEPKPVDKELSVLRLDDLSHKPIAVLVNFAAHPTMIPADTLKFSADYVGGLRTIVEKEMNTTALFMQGACGDLSAHRGANKDHRAFGESLGREVIKLASPLESRPAERPSLQVAERRFRFESRTDLSNPVVRMAYALAFFPELIPNYADEYAQGVRPRATVALLNGEIAIVGGSGEFFCNHALRLKERAGFKPLFFFGYCNGYHQYFPTIEAVAEGGYGADNAVAPAEVGAGEEIMNAVLIQLFEMKRNITRTRPKTAPRDQ